MSPLTKIEKSYFDTIRDKASIQGGLQLIRMTLDGKDVAVILTPVHNRFTGKSEGLMPLAMVLDEATISRLRDIEGDSGEIVSPFDLDPNR